MKRALSLILVLLLCAGLMAGCSSSPANVPADDQTVSDAPSAPAENKAPAEEPAEAPAEEPADEPAGAPVDEPTAEPTEEPVEAPAEEPAEEEYYMVKGFAENTIGYPICEDGEITLTMWHMTYPQILERKGEPMGENFVMPELEKRTGINVEYVVNSYFTYDQQMSLAIVAEDYPDMAHHIGYAGGLEQAIEDEVTIDLAPYLETYAPNYLRWIEMTEANHKAAYTDTGRVTGFAQCYNHPQNSWLGYGVRQNWMDELGLEMPTTTDEWHDVLLTFKESKTGGEPPLDIQKDGFTPGNFIEGAFNIDGAKELSMIQKNDVIETSYRSEGLRQYLEMMHSWFAEGLIDRDFVSLEGFFNATRMANNWSGIVPVMYTQAGSYVSDTNMAEAGTYMTLMPYVEVEGIERNIYNKGKYSAGMGSGGAVIFDTCEHKEEAIRWFDYRYSEEGYMLTNYGIQGVTFDFDENGQPYQLELLTNNPDGLNIGDAMECYLLNGGAGIFWLEREEAAANDEGRRYNELWSASGDWNLTGTLSYTAEEGEARGTKATDIETYASEFICKVIMGDIELNDSTWAEFQDTLTAMGIDEVIEIAQTAYNRFLER